MQRLPVWVLTNPRPSFHDVESATVQQMTAKVYGAMNELIDEYNAFAEKANAEIENFQNKTTQEQQKMMTEIIRANREFYSCIRKYVESIQPPAARIVEINLTAAGWIGESSPYYQVVNLENITVNSQINLTPSVEQLAAFRDKDIELVTENTDGIIKVYAIGIKPVNDYVMTATVLEVER